MLDKHAPLLASEIRRLYIEEKLSGNQIAERVGLPWWVIRKLLKKAGVGLRTTSEAVKLRAQERRKLPNNMQVLADLYLNQKLSSSQIAAMFGCCQTTVLHTLHKVGIKTRSSPEAMKLLGLRGDRASRWKGGKQNHDGYVYIYCGNIDGKTVYRAGHILVWEKTHGPLPEGWVVHHLNGDKSDNRVENLIALPRSKHQSTKFLMSAYQKRIRLLESENKVLRKQIRELAVQGLFTAGEIDLRQVDDIGEKKAEAIYQGLRENTGLPHKGKL